MKKRNDFFSELIVGVFMVAVLALLGYFTIVISGVELLTGRERVLVSVDFTDVGGLKERDSVIYRGMKVGNVEKIALLPGHVMVSILVDKDVVLREKCLITVEATSLLGGNFLLAEEGLGAEMPLATTIFTGTPPVNWMRDLGQIARKLNDLTADGGVKNIVSNFEAMSSKLEMLAARIERGEGTLGKLLSTNDQVYADIATTVAAAKTVAGRLEKGEGTMGRLFSADDTVYRDLQQTFARAADISTALSERIEKGEGTVGKLLSKDDSLYRNLQASVADVKAVTRRLAAGEGLLGRLAQDKRLADDAARLIANLKAFSEQLAQGKGTLGKALNDAELYNEVNGLIKDVRHVVDNYRDTTPISTFAGLIGGAL